MERFKLRKRQEAALKRFEKAAAALSKAGVTLLFDYDDNSVYAFGMTGRQEDRFDCWPACSPPENEEKFEIVTGDIDAASKRVDICGIFVDSDWEFGLEKKQ